MTEITEENVTPCGECCDECKHKISGECRGCRETKGAKCSMWDNGCDIYKCTLEHDVYHCGHCAEFPCRLLIDTVSRWDSTGIDVLKGLMNGSTV